MKRAIIHWLPLPLGLLLLFFLFLLREKAPFFPLHEKSSTLLANKTLPLKGGKTLFTVTKVKEPQGIAIEIHKLPNNLPLKGAPMPSPVLEKRFFLYRHQDSFLENHRGHYTNLVFFYDLKGSPPTLLVPTLNAKKKAQLTLYQWNPPQKNFHSSIASPDFYKELKKSLLLGTEGTAP